MFKKIPRPKLIFFGGALALFVIIQILISLGILSPFWSSLIIKGCIMAMVAIGLNLIYGFNGQFSLGQYGFYAIGAYTAADITYRWYNNKDASGVTVMVFIVILTGAAILFLRGLLSKVRGLDPLSAFTLYILTVIAFAVVGYFLGRFFAPVTASLFSALPTRISMTFIFVLAVLIAGMVTAEISFLFGLPVLTLGSDYFGIATLGFTIIVKVLLDNSDTILPFPEMKGARGMVSIPSGLSTWFWVFLFLFLIVLISRNLLHSSYGRAIISVREDEIAAKAMGIDIAEFKNLAFVIGSLFAGIAGGLYAHVDGFLHPNTFNFIKSFDPMIIIVLGGLASITGTVITSLAWILILEGFLRDLLPPGFETWRYVVYPLILILVMLLRPKGIFGDYEMPFLRREVPPLSPTVNQIKDAYGSRGSAPLNGALQSGLQEETTE
jgi:branched-chain amino acid transport system permease protein